MSRAMSKVKQWMGTITATTAKGDEPEIAISSGLPDRMGDRVLPAGADVENFLKNPALTWAHSRDELPIGTITHLEIGPTSRIRWRWLEGDSLAQRVKNAWDQGIVRAASIEFLPKPGGRQANDHGGSDYTAWELLAVSLVPLPAHPQAVRAFKRLGLWPAEDSKGKLTVDLAAYQKWWDRSPALEGTMEDTRTPVEKDFAEQDARHAVVRAASDGWDRVDPRGAMGTVPNRPDFTAMDEGYRPPETRGFAGLNPAQQEVFDRQRRYAMGLVAPTGPARSHSVNLVGQRTIDVQPGAVTEAVRRTVAEFVRGLGAKIDSRVAAALNRARGKID